MDRRRIALYVVYPVASVLVLGAMYFSGVPALTSVVVPRVEGVRQPRELGLLENLQNLYLLAFVVVAVLGAMRHTATWQRALFCLATLFGIFVLLEELDWGTAYHDYVVAGRATRVYREDFVNFHNIGGTETVLKRLNDAALVAYFLLFPLLVRARGRRWVAYFRPHPLCAATVAAMFLLSSVAHRLEDTVEHWGLAKGMSEFRELDIYWLWLLYLCELVYARRWQAAPAGARAAPASTAARADP